MERNWKRVSDTKAYRFGDGDEPEILHIIRSGFVEEIYLVFEEDPFYTAPSVSWLTREQIKEQYGIDVPRIS